MKKSQVAAALALAYVAGTVVAPVSNIYAEAVLTGCETSVVEDTSIVTAAELGSIVAGIKALPVYSAYKNAVDAKVKYAEPVQFNGIEVSYAKSLDLAVDAADAEKVTKEGEFTTAKAAYDAYGDAEKTAFGNRIKQLNRHYVIDTTKDVEGFVADAEAVDTYEEYAAIREKAKAGDIEGAQDAIISLNRTQANFFGDATVLGKMLATNLTASQLIALLNGGGQGLATHYSNLYNEVEAAKNVIETLEDATTAKEAASKKVEVAKEVQEAAIAEIVSTDAEQPGVLETLRQANVTVADITKTRTKVEDAAKLITEKLNGKHNIISNFNAWEEFVTYVEDGIKEDEVQDAYAKLDAYLSNPVIASEDEKAAILNPTADRKVCDANGIVAVKGNLPLYHLAVEVLPLEGKIPGLDFDGVEQAAYSIKLKYQNNDYEQWDSEGYDVVINVPDNIRGDTAKVYYVANDGSLQLVLGVNENYDEAANTITFHTDHFSVYALAGESSHDDSFGGHDDDDQFQQDGPDEDFGGFEDPLDPDFNVEPEKPIVSVNPDPETPEDDVKLPEASTPNTGIVATSEATASKTNATVAIVASLIAAAGAAIAMIARIRNSFRK